MHQTFLQAKTVTKIAYAIFFCFAKRNISLVKLSIKPFRKAFTEKKIKKGLL